MANPNFQNLVGRTFNSLIVVTRVENGPQGNARWLCWCLLCGNETIVSTYLLRSGKTKSCGCLRLEILKRGTIAAKTVTTKHGHCRRAAPLVKAKPSRTYESWHQMNQRCLNPKATGFKHYGGRGITICDRWNREKGGTFENFLADMGDRPEKMTLDRIDNETGYEPHNVRWASRSVQNRNRRYLGRKNSNHK